MNMKVITLEDCLINYEVNYLVTIINDGQVIGFEEDVTISNYTPHLIFQMNN